MASGVTKEKDVTSGKREIVEVVCVVFVGLDIVQIKDVGRGMKQCKKYFRCKVEKRRETRSEAEWCLMNHHSILSLKLELELVEGMMCRRRHHSELFQQVLSDLAIS